jgi:site-specific DNA recombinase
MIAAIYARKSTEQAGVADDQKSVARQIEHAKAYAIKKGWSVNDECIYYDDGISGAEFVKRPGLLRLMNALKPRPPFGALVMMEESRIGREQIETSYVLKQITDAGVRVFFYAVDQERRLDTALDKIMLSLSNFAAEMEREKACQRTYEAMVRKAKAGHVLGGKAYGYDNVVLMSVGLDGRPRRSHVIRKVNAEEAAVVRHIFEMYASGLGITRIAKALNANHVVPPRGGAHGWAPSAIREIIRRQLYVGITLWNRTKSVQKRGTKHQERRPEVEWLRVDAPELRIVPEEVWKQVQGRLKKAEGSYVRGAGGRLLGRPTGEDFRSEYLLSGLAKCAICGGSLVAMTRQKGKHSRKTYGCVY